MSFWVWHSHLFGEGVLLFLYFNGICANINFWLWLWNPGHLSAFVCHVHLLWSRNHNCEFCLIANSNLWLRVFSLRGRSALPFTNCGDPDRRLATVEVDQIRTALAAHLLLPLTGLVHLTYTILLCRTRSSWHLLQGMSHAGIDSCDWLVLRRVTRYLGLISFFNFCFDIVVLFTRNW